MERCARECLLRFDSGLQQYNDGSAVVVLFQSASCDCPGRASGRGWKSWILKNVTFTLDTDPPTPAPSLNMKMVRLDCMRYVREKHDS